MRTPRDVNKYPEQIHLKHYNKETIITRDMVNYYCESVLNGFDGDLIRISVSNNIVDIKYNVRCVCDDPLSYKDIKEHIGYTFFKIIKTYLEFCNKDRHCDCEVYITRRDDKVEITYKLFSNSNS